MSKEPSTATSSAPTAATTNGAAARTAGEVPRGAGAARPEPSAWSGRARYRSPGARSSCFGAFGGGEPSSSLIGRSYAPEGRDGILSDRDPPVARPAPAQPDGRASPRPRTRLRAQARRLATRAARGRRRTSDPTYADRIGEAGLRNLLQDATVFIDRLALCVAGDDPHWLREFADQTATGLPPARGLARRRDQAVRGHPGQRSAACSPPTSSCRPTPRSTTAIVVFRFHRRLAGDARKRNPIIAALYKGG